MPAWNMSSAHLWDLGSLALPSWAFSAQRGPALGFILNCFMFDFIYVQHFVSDALGFQSV